MTPLKLLALRKIEHTLYILSKIVLAGLHALLSPASIAELSWACGRVFYHVFGGWQVKASTT